MDRRLSLNRKTALDPNIQDESRRNYEDNIYTRVRARADVDVFSNPVKQASSLERCITNGSAESWEKWT